MMIWTHAQRYRRGAMSLAADAEAALVRHPWPGNVRELRNAMEQAVLMSAGATVGLKELAFLALDGLAPGGGPAIDGDLNLERMERAFIERALQRSGGNVTQAARLLGVSRDTLRYRLDRLGLKAEPGDGLDAE